MESGKKSMLVLRSYKTHVVIITLFYLSYRFGLGLQRSGYRGARQMFLKLVDPEGESYALEVSPEAFMFFLEHQSL